MLALVVYDSLYGNTKQVAEVMAAAIGLLASIDAAAVRRHLKGRVPARVAAGILIVLAVLFTIMNLSAIFTALGNPAPNDLLDFPVWIADFTVMAPLWLLGGILLWQRKPLGYVAGTGLYLLGSLLFLGAMFVLAYPAVDAGAVLDVMGIVFMLFLGLICFVPLALFMRASVESGRDASPAK